MHGVLVLAGKVLQPEQLAVSAFPHIISTALAKETGMHSSTWVVPVVHVQPGVDKVYEMILGCQELHGKLKDPNGLGQKEGNAPHDPHTEDLVQLLGADPALHPMTRFPNHLQIETQAHDRTCGEPVAPDAWRLPCQLHWEGQVLPTPQL